MQLSAGSDDRPANAGSRSGGLSSPADEFRLRLEVATAKEKQARWRRSIMVLATLTAVAVFVVGPFVVARQTVLPEFWANQVVTAYFEALDNRDWDALTEVVAPAALGGHEQRFALQRQLRFGSTYVPPQQVRVVDVTVTDAQAVVDVEYRLWGTGYGGVFYGASLQLRRSDKLVGRMLAQWLIEDPFGTLDSRMAESPISTSCGPAVCADLNGTVLPEIIDPAAHAPLQSPILPGKHELTLRTALGRSSVDVVVQPGSNHRVW